MVHCSKPLFLSLLLTCLLTTGTSKALSDAPKRIGVSLLTKEHYFFRKLEQGLVEAAKRHQLQLSITYAEYDHQRQAAQVQDLMANQKVQALVLSPCNSKAVGEIILKANRAKVPVFTVDIANLSGKGKVVAHIASDNVAGGRQAGRLMVEALKGKGKVVIINHPNITSCMDRVAAFRDYLKNFPAVEIMADIPAWGQRTRAMAIMEDLLLMMTDLKGVFAINDESALGAVNAIEAAGMSGKISVIGYDGTPEAKQAIQRGQIYGDVVQYPQALGVQTIQVIKEYFLTNQVKPLAPVKVGVIRGGTTNAR